MESLEIRRVKNGYCVVVITVDSTDEYVFDTYRKVLKFIKDFLDNNKS